MNDKQLKSIFTPIWDEVAHISTRDIFKNVFKNHKEDMETPEDYINHSLYFEAKTFLHGLLVVEDKISMAHGLETRLPFLDNDLVDFAMRCPVHLKLNNLAEEVRINENESGNKPYKFFQKTRDGKQIMRNVMKRHIPELVTNAEKQGFSAPDASWFKGDSIDFVKRVLLNGEASIFEFMDPSVVKSLVKEHLNGSENRRLLIWSLLNIEQWLNDSEIGLRVCPKVS